MKAIAGFKSTRYDLEAGYNLLICYGLANFAYTLLGIVFYS